jgi:hypothetical protein
MDENTPSDDIDCGAEDPTAPELQGGTKHTHMIFINLFSMFFVICMVKMKKVWNVYVCAPRHELMHLHLTCT